MKSDLSGYLHEMELDAIVITGMSTHNPSLNYFTGDQMFTKATVIVPRTGDPILYYRPMERDNAQKTGMKCVCLDELPTGPVLSEDGMTEVTGEAASLRKMLVHAGVSEGDISFAGSFEFAPFFDAVDEFAVAFPQYGILTRAGHDAIQQARYTKDEAEIEAIRAMGKITVGIVGEIEDYIRNCRLKEGNLVTQEGNPVTIGQIKSMINLKLAAAGAENPEGTIFAQGRDAGVPHNSGDDAATIVAEKTIVFDFFPRRLNGFFYDFTRTWYIGTPPQWLHEKYDQVKAVHDEVLRISEAGLDAKALQIKTCDMLEAFGHKTIRENPTLTNGYVHSISHGLGLNIHERPSTSLQNPRTEILQVGSVYTIEPGVYYPDGPEPYGIRIENTVVIGADGKAEILVDYPYQLGIDVPEFGT